MKKSVHNGILLDCNSMLKTAIVCTYTFSPTRHCHARVEAIRSSKRWRHESFLPRP